MALKSTIAEMLGGSPIRPLQQHMESVVACVDLLPRFVDAVVREDWSAARDWREQIVNGEHDADRLKKSLRKQLPTHLFMAVDRRDLLDMLQMQDKVANKTKDISGLMLGRRMRIPPPMVDLFGRYVTRTVAAAHQALKAIQELDALLDTGFRGRETAFVEGLLRELDEIEHETDTLQVELREQLMSLERDWPPVDVIFLYQIIDWIGDLADRAQRVGSRLQVLVAK
ncbi:MAG: TIGR00153 family protein [Polycyclovorans sp.]|jgi:hypothetical protein|nr:TIGR00153 family protein [Polycyclovorans sp.]MBU0791211.1 TIGR00153 family protein [Gammaproteobacteria bacterium]MEC8848954.1 TIGR00153 family protein [Pseudomonadota bacterium]